MEITFKRERKISKREREERRQFIKTWVEYMKNNPNEVWSRQQAGLVNSMLKSANQSIDLYIKTHQKKD